MLMEKCCSPSGEISANPSCELRSRPHHPMEPYLKLLLAAISFMKWEHDLGCSAMVSYSANTGFWEDLSKPCSCGLRDLKKRLRAFCHYA